MGSLRSGSATISTIYSAGTCVTVVSWEAGGARLPSTVGVEGASSGMSENVL
jgi:hypothetical protein